MSSFPSRPSAAPTGASFARQKEGQLPRPGQVHCPCQVPLGSLEFPFDLLLFNLVGRE